MSSISRQNTLLVAESWTRIYEALSTVDFRAYDQNNIVQAIFNYLKNNYGEQYNDYAASSEFMTKVEIMAWLSQNLAFRTELNSRENFLATAERRDSLIRLAQNVGYKINRVRSANGKLRINAIKTTQSITDSNGINIQNRIVQWSDVRDEDWYERFILIMNQAFTNRTQFGSPLAKWASGTSKIEQYTVKSNTPTSGTYPFTASVDGSTLNFDIYNGALDEISGIINEQSPTPTSAYNIFYQLDGTGFNSIHSGFFMPFVQGSLQNYDIEFNNPVVLRTVDIPRTYINNDDFFIQELASDGTLIKNWQKVDTVMGEGVNFNTISSVTNNVYELDTLINDGVRVRFGDGTFGTIPTGIFRMWYRTASPTPVSIPPSAIQSQLLTIPYQADGNIYYLTLFYNLETTINNGTTSESSLDIKRRVGKIFYTQNRMVNAQDYNNLFLKDNSIIKAKTVNRTYTGHSRYSRITDPTSLYQNVSHVAKDGRMFIDIVGNTTNFSADTAVLPTRTLITQSLRQMLVTKDKQTLYYNNYPEITPAITYNWKETSKGSVGSNGNIQSAGISLPLGANTTGELRYITRGAVVRMTSPAGTVMSVSQMANDGSVAGDVSLSDYANSGTSIFSIMPAFRTTFTPTEESELALRLDNKVDFGVAWDYLAMSWKFINIENLNTSNVFSIVDQGDTTGAHKDASWMIRFAYVKDLNGETWVVTDRGQNIFFESAREIDFVFSNNKPLVDTTIGKRVWDYITVLGCNQSKNSALRKNSDIYKYLPCTADGYYLVGDGLTKRFHTSKFGALPENTFVFINNVYQRPDIDYTIEVTTSGIDIIFTIAPMANTEILILFTIDFAHGSISTTIHDTITVEDRFPLIGFSDVRTDNVIAWIDSILQTSTIDDFAVTGKFGTTEIVYNANIPVNTRNTIMTVTGIEANVFRRINYFADGLTTNFNIPIPFHTLDTVLLSIDGIIQNTTEYTVSTDGITSNVAFLVPPLANTNIRIIAPVNVNLTRTSSYLYNGDGTTVDFSLSNLPAAPASDAGIIVAIDGVMQAGPWSDTVAWTLNGTAIKFVTAPLAGEVIHIYHLESTFGPAIHIPAIQDYQLVTPTMGTDISSCLVKYLGIDVNLTPTGVLTHPDGYINKNGLAVQSIDTNTDGVPDNPFLYKDLVYNDGSDLLLWYSISEYGYSIFEPIDTTTTPKGTYATNGITSGDVVDVTINSYGDIHYDKGNTLWLVADSITGLWTTAVNQNAYKVSNGRSGLEFLWNHYTSDSNRVDPAKSNIMNVYLLTSGYDAAYRNWLLSNGSAATMPVPETSDQLYTQFKNFNNSKPISDSIIYYPAMYKPLFGKQAAIDLQATIKIIQTKGSTLTQSDLKLRVLSAIDTYFNATEWDFGESFYFTELAGFVHSMVAPDLQSIVIVPNNNNQAFGRMFQLRAQPNELFVSAASPEDIIVVQHFTDTELKIGTLL